VEIFHNFDWGQESLTGTTTQALSEKKKESLITYVYVGSIFIVFALIFVINTGVWNKLVNFFSTLILAPVPGTGISLPAPQHPANYVLLYNAAFELSLGIGILEIIVLAVRIWLCSPLARRAETIENLVFWLSTSFLIVTYLEKITIQTEWFVFWAGVILIGGLALLARSFILIVKRKTLNVS